MSSTSRPALPGFALSAGMVWLLAGALFKLFEGSPNDLPKLVTEQSPLNGWDTMRAAVGIELAVVGLVIALPRIGWLFLAGTFGVFLSILIPMVQEGVESCGCFGGTIDIDPLVMAGIDGGLLLLILFSRPWRLPKDSGLGFTAFLPWLAAAVAAPLWMLKPVEAPKVEPPTDLLTDAGGPAVTPAAMVDEAASDEGVTNVVPVAETEEGGETATEPVPEESPEQEEEVGNELPQFAELAWQDWGGKDFWETDVAGYAQYATDGVVMPNSHVVVYRRTCDVCAEHLETLFTATQNDPNHLGGKTLVLLRIAEEKDATEENLCALPEQNLVAEHVTLPVLERGYGITTPMSFEVNGEYVIGNVVNLRE